MKKSSVIIIVILIIGAVFWMFKAKTNAPTTETTNTPATAQISDTDISIINKDIDSIDVGNTDQEFSDVSKDLQGL